MRGAYSYVHCWADRVVEPAGTDDVVSALKDAAGAAAAAGAALKVRVTQALFHSSAPFTCPGQADALAPGRAPREGGALSVLISQSKMKKVLAVDAGARTLRVSPGIQLWELAEAATSAGLSLPVGSLPVFGGLTLGGALAAGAHGMGDGPGRDSAPIDFVTEIVWVDASGARHVATPRSEEWNGLYGGLGLVGVMTEIVVTLEPESHTRVSTRSKIPDDNMVSDIEGILQQVGVGAGESRAGRGLWVERAATAGRPAGPCCRGRRRRRGARRFGLLSYTPTLLPRAHAPPRTPTPSSCGAPTSGSTPTPPSPGSTSRCQRTRSW
jgi:FAD/FMN-containing dehydrogenase